MVLGIGILGTQPREQLVVHGDLVGDVAERPLGLLGKARANRGVGQDGELEAGVGGIVHRLLEDAVHGRRGPGARRADADQRFGLRLDLARDGDGLVGVAGGVVVGELHLGHGAVAQLHPTCVVDGLHRRGEHGLGVDPERAQRPGLRAPSPLS